MNDWIGWFSSAVLVVTLFAQVRKQWHDDTSKGVSPWLFVGQLTASTGFLIYSLQIGNWVFAVTNVLTAVAAGLGLWITRLHARRRSRSQSSAMPTIAPRMRSEADRDVGLSNAL